MVQRGLGRGCRPLFAKPCHAMPQKPINSHVQLPRQAIERQESRRKVNSWTFDSRRLAFPSSVSAREGRATGGCSGDQSDALDTSYDNHPKIVTPRKRDLDQALRTTTGLFHTCLQYNTHSHCDLASERGLLPGDADFGGTLILLLIKPRRPMARRRRCRCCAVTSEYVSLGRCEYLKPCSGVRDRGTTKWYSHIS